MQREMCYRCFWPQSLCWCGSIVPIKTRTKILILMHPKEFKEEKSATGRLTHICLENSEIYMGVNFDESKPVQRLLCDPHYLPLLLYPGRDALVISPDTPLAALQQGKQLLVILLDATWRNAAKMYKRSPSLQRLPKIMFVPQTKSRYVIKKQPHEWCLSTLEATHELLRALETAGLDTYDRPEQLLDLFDRMQTYQIQCMQDPTRQHYRRGIKTL